MARRRCYLHIDLAGLTGNRLAHDLVAYRDALRDQGRKVPVHRAQEADLAAIELRRSHAAHGLQRRQVEGTWAKICRRAWRGRKTPLLSVPGLGACDGDQIALALDALAGMKIYLLASVPAVADLDTQARVSARLDLWRQQLRHGRVLRQPVQGATDWSRVSAAFFDLAGVEPPAPGHELGQCGSQASSSAVREVTSTGSSRSASC